MSPSSACCPAPLQSAYGRDPSLLNQKRQVVYPIVFTNPARIDDMGQIVFCVRDNKIGVPNRIVAVAAQCVTTPRQHLNGSTSGFSCRRPTLRGLLMLPELQGLHGGLRLPPSSQIPDQDSHKLPWRRKEKRQETSLQRLLRHRPGHYPARSACANSRCTSALRGRFCANSWI
jgi:hypothetical protein